jgi:ATP-dependent Clp protease adaptor protein ClpS
MSSTVIERPGVLEGPVGNIEIELEEQPPYAVMLHNDDVNSFEWVIKVLNKVFGYGYWRCLRLAMKAHASGQSNVWSGALEIAELRADQMVSCGPDPLRIKDGARPLRVTLDPMR